jgi:hypothetical protein
MSPTKIVDSTSPKKFHCLSSWGVCPVYADYVVFFFFMVTSASLLLHLYFLVIRIPFWTNMAYWVYGMIFVYNWLGFA